MSSLQEVYVSVKGLIADNLSTMGVTGYSSSDGLTTLANAILEVEGGSDLTISLDLVSSSSSIVSGQTVNLTATLTATYDGETVDLNSVLKNAPITFKEGNTTINTVSTNTNGVATISNYAPVGTGTVTLSAQFPSTDGFDGATDVITITVEDVSPVATSLSLTADKSILSYADSESATLSATVLDQFDDPMSGETVEFFNGSTSMGTATTNASGVATKSYSSTGVGDVSFTAEVGSLVSETFSIHDYWLYSTTIPSYTEVTLAGDYKQYIFNTPINLPSAFKLTFKTQVNGNTNNMSCAIYGESTNDYYYSGIDGGSTLHCISRNNSRAVLGQNSHTISWNTDYNITITFDGTNTVVCEGNNCVTNSNSEYDKVKFLGLFVGKSSTFSNFKIEKL